MVRIVFITAIIFILVNFSFAQNINGKWKGQMESPNGPMELTFTFKTSGDTLTGGVESAMGEIPMSNGKMNGNTFAFDINIGEMVINHQCTYLQDSISVKVPGMQGEMMEMILKRVPEPK